MIVNKPVLIRMFNFEMHNVFYLMLLLKDKIN